MEKACPSCQSENIYQDGLQWVCPECSHEWMEGAPLSTEMTEDVDQVKDANGNVLKDGDSVIVIKDLKIKGSSTTIKGGTKVKSIRLGDAGNGHDVSCKIDGIGSVFLKSEFLRKSN